MGSSLLTDETTFQTLYFLTYIYIFKLNTRLITKDYSTTNYTQVQLAAEDAACEAVCGGGCRLSVKSVLLVCRRSLPLSTQSALSDYWRQ